MTIANSSLTGDSAVGGPMADGIETWVRPLGVRFGRAVRPGSSSPFPIPSSRVMKPSAVRAVPRWRLAEPMRHSEAACNYFGGTLNVTGCAVTGNQAIGRASAQSPGGVALGGGIMNLAGSTLDLTDSTVSTNLCQGGQGAPAARQGASPPAPALAMGVSTPSRLSRTSIISLNESVGGLGGAGGRRRRCRRRRHRRRLFGCFGRTSTPLP